MAALQSALPAAGCHYVTEAQGTADPLSWRPSNASNELVVLNLDLFVSGRRAVFAKTQNAQHKLLAFHCNFRLGWKSKCETLRKLDMLHVSPTSPAGPHKGD